MAANVGSPKGQQVCMFSDDVTQVKQYISSFGNNGILIRASRDFFTVKYMF